MAGIDFDTIAGAKLFIATAKATPAEGTGAAAAFAALTWLEFGQITNMGSVEGREYSTSTLSTIGDGQDREKLGTFKLPNADFEFAWTAEDVGQIAAKAAMKTRSVVSFKAMRMSRNRSLSSPKIPLSARCRATG